MKINSLNVKNKNINLHNKLYMLFIHNRKNKTIKIDIRIMERVSSIYIWMTVMEASRSGHERREGDRLTDRQQEAKVVRGMHGII